MTPTVWASTDKGDNVAFAVAGDPVFGGLLKLTLLVRRPICSICSWSHALVLLDRETHRFLSVKFRHGR
jgi:hypothetical protein